MKVHNRYRLRRLWLSILAILIGTAAGASIGRVSILHATDGRLASAAVQVLHREDEIQAEVSSVLGTANQTTYPRCSENDIAQLRRLTFQARFLKDVGHFDGTGVLCSATYGRPDETQAKLELAASENTALSDRAAFQPMYRVTMPAGERAEAVVRGDAYAVLSPALFADFSQRALLVETSGAGNAEAGAAGTSSTDAANSSADTGSLPAVVLLSGTGTGGTSIPAASLRARKAVRSGGLLYQGECSSSTNMCAVASLPLAAIWGANQGLMLGYVGTGGAAGLSCAMVLLLADVKGRSPTNQLKRAILMGKLSVAYQPIVEFSSHRMVGAEALARWTDEDGNTIRPETILALADAEGFVSEITRFVLTRALDELGSILQDHPSFRLHINLAPSDLADPRLLLMLNEKLHAGTVAPSSLAFELPERATTDREMAIAAIRRLRERGHAVFIDDFGTGYSNLAYLHELKVDGIKISRSFIATIGTDSVAASIVPQILAVAKALDLQTVVQGIEREEQAAYFTSIAAENATGNVHRHPFIVGQGWFFGLPVTSRSLAYLCREEVA